MVAIPVATDVDGQVRFTWVATIADTSAVSAAAVQAGVELACWVDGLAGWQSSMSQSPTVDKRACAPSDYEGRGRKTRSLKVRYVTAPQGTNTAKTTLAPGTLGYIVERRGLPTATAYAAAQKVNVWPVMAGDYEDLAGEENAKFKTQQALFVRDEVIIDSVLAA